MARRVHNADCNVLYPKVIIRPVSTEDVAAGVRVARRMQMEISVRSGGHDFICANLKNHSLHFDLRKLKTMELHPGNKNEEDTCLLQLGPGLTWGQVLEHYPPTEYTMIRGHCLSVGVGGFLLRGGVNCLGTTRKYGNGANHVLEYTIVLADGSIVKVDNKGVKKVAVDHDKEGEQLYTRTSDGPNLVDDRDLFAALKVAGSSFGIVTEFLYKIYKRPEFQPTAMLVIIRDTQDLDRLEKVVEEGRYSINMIGYWDEYKETTIWFITKMMQLFYGGHPVPVWLTDLKTEEATTELDPALVTLARHGVVVPVPYLFQFLGRVGVVNTTPLFTTYSSLYVDPSVDLTDIAVASANMMTTSDKPIHDFLFNDTMFGLPATSFKESTGCKMCYWTIPMGERTGSDLFAESRGQRLYIFELTCQFDISDAAGRKCRDHVRAAKTRMTQSTEAGYETRQYYNTPSCGSSEKSFQERYMGPSYARLLKIKQYWDPDDVFHHCHSVGSQKQDCCVV